MPGCPPGNQWRGRPWVSRPPGWWLAAQITAPANAIGKILRGHMDTSIVENGRAAGGHRNRPARIPLSALSQHGSICRSRGRFLNDHLLLHMHAEVTRHRGEILHCWKRGMSILTNDNPKKMVPTGFDWDAFIPHLGAPVLGRIFEAGILFFEIASGRSRWSRSAITKMDLRKFICCGYFGSPVCGSTGEGESLPSCLPLRRFPLPYG